MGKMAVPLLLVVLVVLLVVSVVLFVVLIGVTAVVLDPRWIYSWFWCFGWRVCGSSCRCRWIYDDQMVNEN